ncbi:MAG TPA: hypothetical protein VK586_17260 [Streptosporangiaceae bacterium]|nr:hypothetical protein [Streptosporangiaceae bacterium]
MTSVWELLVLAAPFTELLLVDEQAPRPTAMMPAVATVKSFL